MQKVRTPALQTNKKSPGATIYRNSGNSVL